MRLTDFKALTFDCYGTLIDWETGIARALASILGKHGVRAGRDELLARFAHHEAELEAGPYRPYRDVLERVAEALAAEHGVELSPADAARLPASIRDWPPFDDTVVALHRLGQRYRLGILSNVDDDLFAGSARRLEIEFEPVVTAQQAGSYKPARQNFELLLERVGVPPERVLHVAQSLYHDVAPAREIGLATVWVDRRAGQEGSGATPPATATPDARVESLAELADLLQASPG